MRKVEVIRTYLQMLNASEHVSAIQNDLPVRIERVHKCPVSFYRYLYIEVGKNYSWIDRLSWTDDQIQKHLDQSSVQIWVLYGEGSPAGYFELNQHPDNSVEIAYFGLLPEFIGRGLGKHLLSSAINLAWEMKPSRVWLHTCTLDDPAAVPNYLKRGFKPYKQETYTAELPD